MSELKTIEVDGLHISVPYSFHKDKIDEIKSKKMIEACLAEIFLERIALKCEVDSSQLQKSQKDEITNLAADFGGEIV